MKSVVAVWAALVVSLLWSANQASAYDPNACLARLKVLGNQYERIVGKWNQFDRAKTHAKKCAIKDEALKIVAAMRSTGGSSLCLRPGMKPVSTVLLDMQKTIIDRDVARYCGKKKPEATSTCGMTVSKNYKACMGSDERCQCISVRNHCPYSVSASFRVDGLNRNGSVSVSPGDTENFCATKNGSQGVEYLGWKPWAGFPKPGQPKPKGN